MSQYKKLKKFRQIYKVDMIDLGFFLSEKRYPKF